MDAAQIKMISHEFRDLVSRTANSSHEHLQVNLCRLLDFIDETRLLREVVEEAPRPEVTGEEVVRRSLKQGGRQRIQTPREPREEIGFLHDLLVHMSRMDAKRFEQFVMGYGYSVRLRENVERLMEDTVVPYAGHLRRMITASLLRASPDRGASRLDVVTSEGGLAQIVVHQGTGDVHSTQTASTLRTEVLYSAEALRKALEAPHDDGPSDDQLDELKGIVNEVRLEATRERPSKWGLKAIRDRLVTLAGAIGAASKVGGQIMSLANVIGRLLGLGPQ